MFRPLYDYDWEQACLAAILLANTRPRHHNASAADTGGARASTDTRSHEVGGCVPWPLPCMANESISRRYYKPAFNKTHVPEAIPGQIDAENKPQPADDKLTNGPNTLIESDAPAAQLLVDGPDESRLLAHDPTLTALAQLGAFRLNCQRSIISLMDKENQYILAEATRTVSLHSPLQCEPGDEIYLGPRTLDMVWGVCPNVRHFRADSTNSHIHVSSLWQEIGTDSKIKQTLQVFTAPDNSTDVSTSLVTANKDCYVMNDLSAIEAYKSRPYVAGVCPGFLSTSYPQSSRSYGSSSSPSSKARSLAPNFLGQRLHVYLYSSLTGAVAIYEVLCRSAYPQSKWLCYWNLCKFPRAFLVRKTCVRHPVTMWSM